MRTFLVDATCATGTGAAFMTTTIWTVAGFETPLTTFDVSEAMAGAAATRKIARAAKTVFTAAVRGLTVRRPNNGQAIGGFQLQAAFAAAGVSSPVFVAPASLRHASTAPRSDET